MEREKKKLRKGGKGDEGPFFLGSEELWGVGWDISERIFLLIGSTHFPPAASIRSIVWHYVQLLTTLSSAQSLPLPSRREAMTPFFFRVWFIIGATTRCVRVCVCPE